MEKYEQIEMGSRIRMLRGSISQSDLAEQIGTSQGTIAKYEKGMKPDVEILLRMSNYFRVTMEYIFTGNGPPPAVHEEPDHYIAKVSDLMRQVDENTKAHILHDAEKEKWFADQVKTSNE